MELTTPSGTSRRLGLAIVGLGGAVATTAVAGIALLKRGKMAPDGLPLALLDPSLTSSLASYEHLAFGGWDLDPSDLYAAAAHHNVLRPDQLDAVSDELRAVSPWKAVRSDAYCKGVTGEHCVEGGHRGAVNAIRADLRRFREDNNLDGVVLINLASTEAAPNPGAPELQTPDAFAAAVDADSPAVSPAMLYAYAAVLEGVPYGNFTPSTGGDIPALIALGAERGVPLAGKDGKTGQTFIKTVLAPALRDRGLHVDGWFSTNILGNRDGEALRDPDSLGSKIGTKGSVLDQILGYPVDDHVVKINYYRPRGDNKEAWDNIDVTGFLGQEMQIKVNFLCRDSILAAPLAIEIARTLDLAHRRGEGGVARALSVFFKLPMTATPDEQPEHSFPVQQQMLIDWLARPTPVGGDGAPADAAADTARA
jgi:myo-inositol-1-phosphate synthase